MAYEGIEEWRVVAGFENYIVSNRGRVKRECFNFKDTILSANHTMKLDKMRSGHLRVGLTGRDGKRKRMFVHQLVCAAWHGPKPSPKHQVAHFDGDPLNNHPSNLRWATAKENVADAKRHGTLQHGLKPGEDHYNAKLTEAQVRLVRRMRHLRNMSYQKIADYFGVSVGCISDIIYGRTWGWMR